MKLSDYKLYLDDIRVPYNAEEYVICRSVKEAKETVLSNGIPSYISFDHDLGPETSMTFVYWFCGYLMENKVDTREFSFSVHSANPIGAKAIDSYLKSFLSVHEEQFKYGRY